MGRVKLKIKRLENSNGRQATYAKRKHGIMKKANELSILCDIDIILLMFSPTTGKPSLCTGKHSIEEVIAKFAQQTPQERAKKKLEGLEVLRKTFKKLDHDVIIQDFLGTSSQTIEELAGQARLLRTQLSEVHQRLSYWGSPERINNADHLTQMENSLRESLNQVRAQKENLQNHPPVPLEFTNQMKNDMHIPFNMSVEQQLQLQNFSWIPSDSQNMILHEDPNFIPHRDLDCSASSSFASFPSYFGTGRSPEMSNSGQENGILPELSRAEPHKPQLGGQNSFMSYNVNFLNDSRFQPAAEMNMPVNPVDYHINGNYDTNQHNWAPSSGPCAVSLLDDRLYPQL